MKRLLFKIVLKKAYFCGTNPFSPQNIYLPIIMKPFFYTLLILSALFASKQTQAQTSGCIGTASISVTIEECVGIEEVWQNANIDLYPNPFRDALYLVLPETMLEQPCQVTISDLSGRYFYSNTTQTSTLNIPTGTLAKGMYIVSVKSSSHIYQRKIAKY